MAKASVKSSPARDGSRVRRNGSTNGSHPNGTAVGRKRPRLAKRATGSAAPRPVWATRTFDAMPDRIDLRDWPYRPSLAPLPDQLINCDHVPLPILDQGREGACTGYALAAVINYLLNARGLLGPGNVDRMVSSRMLYEMARRYDEWPGESYEGSSARGAMMGWVRHGVCSDRSWPKNNRNIDLKGKEHFTSELAEEARLTPGGAYFRVAHREIRDMHAALNDVGILYVTLMVHDGWHWPGFQSPDEPPEKRRVVTVHYNDRGNARSRQFPIIQRVGRAESGHAVAIVGYTKTGFIVQNSWGAAWGEGGFALLPYEDYMLHATDVWVAQLGVPVTMDSWQRGHADTTQGVQRALRAMPLAEIRPYVVNIGNNGELSDSGEYWTTEADLHRLFNDLIPKQAQHWQTKRVLLYLHGGMNDEIAVAKRIVAFRDVMLENEIYPVHIMWESGLHETLSSFIKDLFTRDDEEAERAGDWLARFREGLIEAKDRGIELTAALPVGAMWREMKENAKLASAHRRGVGGMQLIAKHADRAMNPLKSADRKRWELHVVGHSAGSIFAAHAMRHLCGLGMSFKSLQFMAPAITTEAFTKLVLPHVKQRTCPHPTVYNLSDAAERDDTVGPYGKSLLYLVSNAFEDRRETGLLGMERFISDAVEPNPDKRPRDYDGDLNSFFKKKVNGLPSLVIAGASNGQCDFTSLASASHSKTHGGFDNDPATMNSVLRRILGTDPKRPFTERDLMYQVLGAEC